MYKSPRELIPVQIETNYRGGVGVGTVTSSQILELLLIPHSKESGPINLSTQEFFLFVLCLGPGEVCVCQLKLTVPVSHQQVSNDVCYHLISTLTTGLWGTVGPHQTQICQNCTALIEP